MNSCVGIRYREFQRKGNFHVIFAPIRLIQGEGQSLPLGVLQLHGGPVFHDHGPDHQVAGRPGCAVRDRRGYSERKRAEDVLKKAQNHMEEKVKERTAELDKAYNSLKESEKGLAEAQRMAHIGNWKWNIVTNEKYWSDEIYRIFGRSPQEFEVTYDTFIGYIHPDDRDYVDNVTKEALKGKPYSIDFRIVLADRGERIVHEDGEVVFDEKNIPIQMTGIIQDITERKKADEKIKRLANAVESSNDAIVTESLDGIITSWNKAAEKIYGYSAEEILGQNVSILIG